MSNGLVAFAEELQRLAHLAGHAAALEDWSAQIELTAIAIEQLGGDMSVAQVLKDASAAVKTASADVKAAIDAAIARLSDNPTAADIQAVVDDLTAAGTSLADATTAAGTIDPDTAGGVVVDPADPGGVVEG